ncbi:GAF domain-containing protein [Pseudonocardia sediminis]|uniref:GAF domain-containing protein n=1 Tax=Pseudonocardia sediminis TaxID=1397368 RepID=A0A4Q7UYR9_PSEST|nr:GAF and ANTAR domain-containing protein [Pseudonocardia sediminis]RZT87277.1 GAF domain-containing protein [Pseudonocardia sediminis]
MHAHQRDDIVTALRHAAHGLIARRSIDDLDHTVTQIVVAAVQTVPGADAGGISLTYGSGRIDSRSPSGDDVLRLDRLQTELHEGPCITAIDQPPENGVVVARDLAADPDASRWPAFAPHAVEYGYRAMMSVELSVKGITRAALNLYSCTPDVFDDSARFLAELFGAQAALLLYGAGHAANLTDALETRDVIGQAKGILMERFGVDEDQAFRMLVSSSQDTNVKLISVARWLVSESRTGTRAEPAERTVGGRTGAPSPAGVAPQNSRR